MVITQIPHTDPLSQYFPEVGQRELQESTGRRRDMTQAEVEAADEFLRAVTER